MVLVFLLILIAYLIFGWSLLWVPYYIPQILDIISGKKPRYDPKDESYVPRVLVKLRMKLEKQLLKK